MNLKIRCCAAAFNSTNHFSHVKSNIPNFESIKKRLCSKTHIKTNTLTHFHSSRYRKRCLHKGNEMGCCEIACSAAIIACRIANTSTMITKLQHFAKLIKKNMLLYFLCQPTTHAHSRTQSNASFCETADVFAKRYSISNIHL